MARDDIRSIIPGVIRPVRDAKGDSQSADHCSHQNGWKAIGLSNGARQELFISTATDQAELAAAIAAKAWCTISISNPVSPKKLEK